MSMERNLSILSLSGPSGVGKSTILERLKQYGYIRVTPSTTRPRRSQESPHAYRFLTTQEYLEKLNNGEMLFSFFFFERFYGYQKEDIVPLLCSTCTPILEIYPLVVQAFKDAFPTGRSIFMLPESIELLRERLSFRGDDLHSVQIRVSSAKEEIKAFEQLRDVFDHLITVETNDTPDTVGERLLEVLTNAPH